MLWQGIKDYKTVLGVSHDRYKGSDAETSRQKSRSEVGFKLTPAPFWFCVSQYFFYAFFLPHCPSLSPDENRLDTSFLSILCLQTGFLLEALHKEGCFCSAHLLTCVSPSVFSWCELLNYGPNSLLRESWHQSLLTDSLRDKKWNAT